MSSYVTKHTVPVWVYVSDGKVTQVVVDDERLSPPTHIVSGEGRDLSAGWSDEDERPITPDEAAQIKRDHAAQDYFWPGWEFGW